ncbi:PREDICTED: uncharacterized protein LOC104773215 [Camelina sativa]|uniref:Uncharacterized protein LOC104773215 n=1 Tax=Camelina sativa TaxID=90675 RepID=A0ABM0Y627_CAMSA|nr:PREDICTED: uncharacterized protein LOC104773215 [Camelina sativa]
MDVVEGAKVGDERVVMSKGVAETSTGAIQGREIQKGVSSSVQPAKDGKRSFLQVVQKRLFTQQKFAVSEVDGKEKVVVPKEVLLVRSLCGRISLLWTPFSEEAQPGMKSVRLWVTLNNVPPTMFTDKGLEFLSSAVGKPISLHSKTEACISFDEAQVLIEADLTKELPREYVFMGEEEGELDYVIQYSYPWLPPRCTCCQKWGHLAATCLTTDASTGSGKQAQQDSPPTVVSEEISIVQDQAHPTLAVAVIPCTETSETSDILPGSAVDKGADDWITPKSARSSPGKRQEAPKSDADVSLLKNSYSILGEGTELVDEVEKDQGEVAGFCWNVCGLNRSSKHSVIKQWVEGNKFQFGCLLETRVREKKASWLGSHLFPGWSVLTNYEYSPRGRIWVLWKGSVRMDPFYKSEQLITCSVKLDDQSEEFFCSFVYGLKTVEARRVLWQEIKDHHDSPILRNKPWILFGDFNETLDMQEHSRFDANPMLTGGMRDFQAVINHCSLSDMTFHGPLFTWCNKRDDDLILKKLDRVLVNTDWERVYPHAYNVFAAGGCSDHLHCRIVIKGDGTPLGPRRKPFKFVDLMTDMDEFKR